MRRKIIKIDHERCNGCGLCIPNCPEGALQVIDGKARLVNDMFCDGLGACIGHCPEDAIVVEEREVREYDERKVMENIVPQGSNVIKAHLEHLREHGQIAYLEEALDYLRDRDLVIPLEENTSEREGRHRHAPLSCPGSRVMDFREKPLQRQKAISRGPSHLRQWPVQLALVPPFAPYLQGADVLIAADCVPFAFADFHEDLLRGKALLVGCPKLDDAEYYMEKLTQIFKDNDIQSVVCAHMEVPCCFGLLHLVKSAISESGKKIPFDEITVSVKGEKVSDQTDHSEEKNR